MLKIQFSCTASLWNGKNELSSIFQAEGKQSVSCVCLCRHLETEECAPLHQSAAAWNKSSPPNPRTTGTGPPAPLRSEESHCSSMLPSCGLQRGRIHTSRRRKQVVCWCVCVFVIQSLVFPSAGQVFHLHPPSTRGKGSSGTFNVSLFTVCGFDSL